MTASLLPPRDRLSICFAHPSYQLAARLAARNAGIANLEVHNVADLARCIPEADVLVVSGLWRNELLDVAPKLKFVQSISAGINQYDPDRFRAKGVRLASAQGVNEVAVAEHAMALVLALRRHLHTGRDNQSRQHWRPMIADFGAREDELRGKTMLIVGFGRIGQRLARLASAFEMRVIGLRRTPTRDPSPAHEVHTIADLPAKLPQADVVVLTCPLTPETKGLIGAKALSLMKPSALLVNVARGAVVDEVALIAALQEGRIRAAGIDVTVEEPLPASSPLWRMEQVLLTPHTAGETCAYEDNVLDIMLANLDRLWRGETTLINEIV